MTIPYMDTFPESVTKLANEFHELLKTYYPEIANKTYDSFGYPEREGNPALARIRFCIYIELMKAGAFDTFLGVPKKDE
jgi:hypothetical protein